ncbi:hypothetical protein [Terasakiispira papahanaumokuakeensis]|nr:hypothetical protein [Terasakiispira papahanaumokuakeensis]
MSKIDFIRERRSQFLLLIIIFLGVFTLCTGDVNGMHLGNKKWMPGLASLILGVWGILNIFLKRK